MKQVVLIFFFPFVLFAILDPGISKSYDAAGEDYYCYSCDKKNSNCSKSPPEEVFLTKCPSNVRQCSNSKIHRLCATAIIISTCQPPDCTLCNMSGCNNG